MTEICAYPGGKRPSTWPNGCPACWAKERSFWAGVRPDGSYTVFCMAVIMAENATQRMKKGKAGWYGTHVMDRFCPEHRTMFRTYKKLLHENV